MKISLIGAGNIGSTLGGKWAVAGHEVVFGVRDPQAAKVETLIADVGLRPIFIGAVDQAPILDALTQLWFTLGLRQGRGRHVALKMLTE